MPLTPTNLYADLDASAITGHVDGDVLTTIADASGNGHNATGAGSTGVIYRANGRNLNRLPALALAGTNASTIRLSGTSISRRSYTQFVVVRLNAAKLDSAAATLGSGNGCVLSSLDTTNLSHLMMLRGGPVSGSYSHDSFSGGTDTFQTNTAAATYPGIIILAQRANGDTTRMWFNGVQQDITTAYTAATMTSGVDVGYWSGNSSFSAPLQLCEYALYNAAISDADFTANVAALIAKWALPSKLVIHTGNSIVSGLGLNAGEEYPAIVHLDLGPDYVGYNLGVPGQTIEQMTTADPAKIAAVLADPQVSGLTSRAVVTLEFTNSGNPAIGNDTAAQAMIAMLAYRNTVVGTANKHVLVEPVVRTGEDVVLQQCVALIEQNAASFTQIVPTGRGPLGRTGAYYDPTYFQVDQVHPTATGAAIIGHATSPFVWLAINASTVPAAAPSQYVATINPGATVPLNRTWSVGGIPSDFDALPVYTLTKNGAVVTATSVTNQWVTISHPSTGNYSATATATGYVATDSGELKGAATAGGGVVTKTWRQAFTVVAASNGPGADRCTIHIAHNGTPIAQAEVWITIDSAGATPVSGTLPTDSSGNVTFLLTAGDTYYLWARKDGWDGILGRSFVAVAD